MSLLASKMLAINIVDIQDGVRPSSHTQLSDSDTRLALLEAQIQDLKQWKTSLTPSAVSTPPGNCSELVSAPSSPDSLTSLDSSDLPQLDSSKNILASAQPKSSDVQAKEKAQIAEPDATYRILTLIQGYGQNEENAIGQKWLGRINFDAPVRKQVEANAPIDLVLPAFPWKSVNKVEKVMGALPDLGEELGLARLQTLCEDIQAVYPPGAFVTITSDGLVYNDLLGIPDGEVYEYGLGLRQMASERGFDRLRFIRIMNLLGLTDSPHMSKDEYLSACGTARTVLMDKFLPRDFDARSAILTDQDINLTYCGYMVFLAKDLRHSPVTAGISGKNEYKRCVKRVSHDMITRGKAFAAAITAALPHHVRLSIHRSTGLTKLSFPLVPQPNHFSMTPWHCAIAVTAKGQFRTAHAEQLRRAGHWELVERGGRPYCFRDRSEVWNWDLPVDFEYFYPSGVCITPVVKEGEDKPRLGRKEMAKIKELGRGFGTVLALGFA